MSDRAVILAGGKGTRLRPYTVAFPKPLMPIGEIPILELVVRQLVQQGFGHITLAVNHQADLIKAFFGDGAKWEVRIDYSLEDQPLGTMGPLRLINDLPENFIVMNGDVLTDLDYRAFLDAHKKGNNLFTISSYTRNQVSDYGVLEVDQQGLLKGFREKPSVSFQVSMGVYAVSKACLQYIPQGIPYGFDHLMLELIKQNKKVGVHSHEGIWLDIGRPDDYERAIDLYSKDQMRFLKESR